MEEKEIKQKSNKKQLILTIVGVLVLVIAVVGASFAVWNYVFNGTLVNTISTNDISLDLLESNTNIITIENALPMSDNEGKAQTETFDFAVTSKTVKDIDIEYNINIQKLEVDNGYTSLNDNQIKVYLTDYSNTQKVAPTLISNLTNYKLYTGKHSHDTTHETVQDKFKLRAWIDGAVDASNWNQDTKLQYKFKIGLTSEEKQKSSYPSVVYRYGNNTVTLGDSIVRETKNAYCANHAQYGNSCDFGMSWDTEQECQDYVTNNMGGQATCQAGTVTTGFDYTEDYTTLNKNFFLKHNISNEGTVESSEVCYIKDNSLYCLKGEKTDDKEEGYVSQYYEENTNILKTSFGESNCSVLSGNVRCSASGLIAGADQYGAVDAYGDSSRCHVLNDGNSDCYE